MFDTVINILLFLYGLFTGLPDIAIDFYDTRLRLDDGIMIILLFCVFLNGMYQPYHFTKSQMKFLKGLFLFALFCFLSFCATVILGFGFDFYSLFRMLGCILIAATLLAVLKSLRLAVWLGYGMLFGGMILVSQIIFAWYCKSEQISLLEHSYRLKSDLSFSTWNPNTSANYAIMLAFVTALISYEVYGIKKGILWAAAVLFSLVPLFTFARAAAAAVIIAWMIFIFVTHGHRYAKAGIILLFIATLVFLLIYQGNMIRSAVSINLSTGEGLSDHDVMWRKAIGLIARKPMLGHGFGQELSLYKAEYRGGMSQNAYLSVCVEGGLVGLLLFIWPLVYLCRCLWRFTYGRFYDSRAVLCFGFFLGILMLGLTQSTLYWHKSQILMMSLMLVYIGTAERSQTCLTKIET